MIFVDKIEDVIESKKYLRLRLLDCVRNRNQAFVVIQSFISNFDANKRINVIEDFQYEYD